MCTWKTKPAGCKGKVGQRLRDPTGFKNNDGRKNERQQMCSMRRTYGRAQWNERQVLRLRKIPGLRRKKWAQCKVITLVLFFANPSLNRVKRQWLNRKAMARQILLCKSLQSQYQNKRLRQSQWCPNTRLKMSIVFQFWFKVRGVEGQKSAKS